VITSLVRPWTWFCESKGGDAAVIYNNKSGLFSGTLGNYSGIIPVVAISQEDGKAILSLDDFDETKVSVQVEILPSYRSVTRTPVQAKLNLYPLLFYLSSPSFNSYILYIFLLALRAVPPWLPLMFQEWRPWSGASTPRAAQSKFARPCGAVLSDWRHWCLAMNLDMVLSRPN